MFEPTKENMKKIFTRALVMTIEAFERGDNPKDFMPTLIAFFQKETECSEQEAMYIARDFLLNSVSDATKQSMLNHESKVMKKKSSNLKSVEVGKWTSVS